MVAVDIGFFVVGILLIAFALAPSVRSGTANPDVAAALVAGLIGLAPAVFAVTGQLDWDPWLVVVSGVLLFGVSFLGGRAMAPGILNLPKDSPD